MKTYYSLFCYWILSVVGLYGQSAGPEASYWDEFQAASMDTYQINQRDSLQRWEERVYLHTDREQFIPGDHIFFKAYVVNRQTQRRLSPSGVLKLELRDAENKLVDKQYHALNDGVSEGAFRLSSKMDDGWYQLLAYTRWMRNYGEEIFFNKTIQVGAKESSRDEEEAAALAGLSFFPEGGKLLAGISNRMVICAKTDTGKEVPFEGVITDEAGNSSVPVNTYGEGVGQVTFTPSADKVYYLRLKDGRQFPLPEVQKSGYTLKINNLDPNEVFVQSERHGITRTERIFIQGLIDGKPCFENELSYNEQGIAKLEVSKSGLLTGKVDFLLVDGQGQKLAERPVWITAAEQLDIQIEKVVSVRGKRDQHTFQVTVKDRNGQPVQTDLSMAVRTNSNSQSVSPKHNNGRTSRFLEDLKVLSSKERSENGKTFPDEIVYPMQQGLEIMGYAYDLNNELLVNREIQLIGLSDSLWIAREVRTDGTGLLRLRNLDFEGETQLVFRVKGDDTRERLVKLVPLAENSIKVQQDRSKKTKRSKNLALETTPWQPMDTTGLIELDPSTVSAVKKPNQTYSTQYGTQIKKQDVIVQEPERPKPLLELINQIPEVRVIGLGSERPRIQIFRQGMSTIGQPLWVLDGVPLNPLNSSAQGTPTNVFTETALGLIPDLAVDRVEFLFGTAAAVYGSRGANGVFLVYTRDGADSDFLKRKEGQLNFKGFTPRPDIGKLLREQLRKNRKEKVSKTLYWNPKLRTDEQGQVLVEFHSPGNYEQIELHVESITPSGQRGSKKQAISLSY